MTLRELIRKAEKGKVAFPEGTAVPDATLGVGSDADAKIAVTLRPVEEIDIAFPVTAAKGKQKHAAPSQDSDLQRADTKQRD